MSAKVESPLFFEKNDFYCVIKSNFHYVCFNKLIIIMKDINKKTLKALIRHMFLIERDMVLTPFAFFIWLAFGGFVFCLYKLYCVLYG